MAIRSYLPLLVLLCMVGCMYAQNITCDNEQCPGYPPDVDDVNGGVLRDQCCRYIDFVTGCCSQAENDYLKLIRDVIIGVSVGVGGLIIILIFICICCCCCICC